MDSKIFRKVALEKLSSPEQLDLAIRVTNPRGWAALAAFGALLLVALIWGIVGRIPVEVGGAGVLVRSAGLFSIYSPASGTVTEVNVKANDEVKKGQVVARIAQPEIAENVESARADVEKTQSLYEISTRSNTKGLELGLQDLERRRSFLEASIEISKERIARLEEKVSGLENLFAKGLIAKDTLIGAQNDAADEKQAKTSLEDQLKELEASELDLRSGRRTALEEAELQLTDAKSRLAALELQLKTSSEITAPDDGKITAVLVDAGTIVASGTPIVQYEVPDKELTAVLFVSQVDGKKIDPGMEVHLSPANVKQEEYGVMLATVVSVSEFPAPPQQMMTLLQNDALVATLSAGGSPYQVELSLERDPSTKSGFRWTSRRDPPFTITSGTLCGGSIVVMEQRPISLVIPILKKATGL